MQNIPSGKWGIDTNILVYAQDRKSPFYEKSRFLFAQAINRSLEMVVSQQVILEAHSVLIKVYKRPPKEVVALIGAIVSNFSISVVCPLSTTLHRFGDLLSSTPSSNDVFDIYLAATLLDNGITKLLTANERDFTGIEGLYVVNPFLNKNS